MDRINDNLLQLIGRTPLVRLAKVFQDDYGTQVIAKVEAFNPGGSVKDRAARYMIEEAERRGALKPGGTIIEPTSGNTGIGMSWIAAIKGYRVILTMPETMSVERRALLKAYGAQLELTPGTLGMKGAIARAEELCASIPGAIILQQFANAANPIAHEQTTAVEIMDDTDGQLDVFVACVGTGGTVSGTGRKLKSLKPGIEVVAVEPDASPVLSGGTPGPHKIQGIGAGFVPENYDARVVDRIVRITNEEAFEMMCQLARKEGLLVGISSGAAVAAAVSLAREPHFRGKKLVVLLPDTGERYLSSGVFE